MNTQHRTRHGRSHPKCQGTIAAATLLIILTAHRAAAQCAPTGIPVSQTGTPSARSSPSMVADSARDELVLFGGSAEGRFRNDTFTFANGTWTLRTNAGPSARASAAMSYDSDRQRIVLFGGQASQTASGFVSDTWEWDGSSWSLVATVGPSRRAAAAMTYDSVRHRTVLFGGNGAVAAEAFLADTWEWDGSAWLRRSAVGPRGRFSATLVFDEARAECVLFGGSISVGNTQDTWTYDGAQWTERVRAGPVGRSSMSAAYDPVRQVVIAVGGTIGFRSYGTDAWLWNGTSWSLGAANLVTPRRRPGMAFLPSLGGIVIFAGHTDGFPTLNDMYLLASDAPVRTDMLPVERIIRVGDSVTFTAEVPDGATNTWRTSATIPAEPRIVITPTQYAITDARRSDSGLISSNIAGCGTYGISNFLVVLCPADFNDDEYIDADDISDYITAYFDFRATNRTDFNGDGVVDEDDLADFIQSFFSPC